MPVIMSHSSRDLSPAQQVRQELDEIEIAIVASRTSPADMAALLRRVDEIDVRLHDLQQQRLDLHSEQSRLEDLQGRLARDATQVTRQIHTNGQADQLGDSPTWQMLQNVIANRQQRVRQRLMVGAGAIITVAVLLFVVLPWLFPAPPRADVGAVSRLVDAGNFDAALAQAETEQRAVPSDPAAWLWIGALQQRQGNQAAADQAWANAQRLSDNAATFYGNRGSVFLQMSDYTGAEADARILIKQTETAASGYYLLGQAQSGQNKINEAIDSFDQAAKLADRDGNGALVVAAKMETQNLLQRPPVFATATP